jgi:hypothetical protein
LLDKSRRLNSLKSKSSNSNSYIPYTKSYKSNLNNNYSNNIEMLSQTSNKTSNKTKFSPSNNNKDTVYNFCYKAGYKDSTC